LLDDFNSAGLAEGMTYDDIDAYFEPGAGGIFFQPA
jgi:hypothetical protein